MKKLFIAIVLGISLILIAAYQSKAQVNVNINIGTQPYWEPIGYHQVNYYYTQPVPYVFYNDHKVRYAKHRNYVVKRSIIRYNNTPRYYVVKGHPHGMPPGQAKKAYFSNNREKHKSHGHKGGKKH